MFDFMNPVLALWWLINQGGKLGLDEPEPRHYTNIGVYGVARPGTGDREKCFNE